MLDLQHHASAVYLYTAEKIAIGHATPSRLSAGKSDGARLCCGNKSTCSMKQ